MAFARIGSYRTRFNVNPYEYVNTGEWRMGRLIMAKGSYLNELEEEDIKETL
jgi:hypothetical protein